MNDKEKVAQWMIERGFATGHGDSIEDLLKEIEWQIESRTKQAYCDGLENGLDAEREACAKVCEKERNDLLWREGQTLPQGEPRLIHMASTAGNCAAAIRARGEK